MKFDFAEPVEQVAARWKREKLEYDRSPAKLVELSFIKAVNSGNRADQSALAKEYMRIAPPMYQRTASMFLAVARRGRSVSVATAIERWDEANIRRQDRAIEARRKARAV